jgi:hypothetical protein
VTGWFQEEEKVEEEAEEPQEQRISVHRTKSLVERDLYVEHLPELKLLRFLVNCKHLKDLKQYHQYYEYIGQSSDYSCTGLAVDRLVLRGVLQ